MDYLMAGGKVEYENGKITTFQILQFWQQDSR